MTDFFRHHSDFRHPDALAAWTREATNVRPPKVDLDHAIKHFGLRIERIAGLPRNGQLTVVDRRLTIVLLKSAKETVQRFTAAHELGHYLLASQAEVPVSQQARDMRFETYCNNFARHLLLPQDWLRGAVREPTPSLEQVLAVARVTNTSMPTAFIAVNEAQRWNGVLVMFRRIASVWSATQIVGATDRCGLLDSARAVDRFVGLERGKAQRFAMPVVVDGQERSVQAQAIRFRDRGFTLFRAPSPRLG